MNKSILRSLLLAGAAHMAILPAQATSGDTARIEALERQLQLLQAELQDLKRQRAEEAAVKAEEPDLAVAVADLKRSTSAQYADLQKQREGDVQVSLKNGRPTFKTADGDFSASLRALVQYDNAYYSQGKRPPASDFSSGNNFRRARLGVEGTLFKDWGYNLLYEMGGSGTEGASISQAYIEYNGLGAVKLRVGAYPPPESFEDSTSASDLLFLERAQPTDLSRSIAGADGRGAASIITYDDDYYAALSYTGGVVGETAVFDEQQALVGRFAYRVLRDADSNLALGATGTYVFNLADTAAGPGSPTAFRLRARPELNVDSQNIRLIDTNTIDTSSVWAWGVEAAGNWKNLYAQGGYFGYHIDRRASILPNPSFDGWYVQASWVLTGEAKSYRADKAAYGLPSPSDPLTLDGAGIGAWELAARYSVLDLNENPGFAGFATPAGGIRGGRQSIWTAGLNWYPNNALRFQLNYQHTDVSRLNSPGADIGADLDAVSLRAQFSL